MGIGFGREVDFDGAWIAGHGSEGIWARGVRVIGYRAGHQVAESSWMEDLDDGAQWLAASMERVDRIEFEARAAYQGGGWFGLDDLTFHEGAGAPTVLDFDDLLYHDRVSGSGYGGLTWETGQGEFEGPISEVHEPQVPQGGPEFSEVGSTEESLLGGTGTAPTMTDNFDGPKLGDAGAGWIPPDTCGSVGIDHFVAVVNQNLSVYRKDNHSRVVNTGIANFFNTGGSAGDPRAVFDPHSQRFIIIACDFNSRIWLAVSLTSDPTGSWFKTSVLLSQGSDSNRWPDYPTLGVDQNGIYSASYMVGGGMSLFAIDKAPLLTGSPSLGTVTAFRNLPWEGAIQPCVTYGTPGREYCVSRRSSTTMRLRYVQGPLTSPTLVEAGIISVPSHSSPPNAPALGSVAPLDCLDYRPMNAVYRNGSVWTTHGVAVSGRAGCRWYEFDAASASAVQIGTVSDSSLYFMMPSISVNQANQVVVAFSGSDASQYASSYFAGRIPSDPANQLSQPVLLRAGSAPYNTVGSSGVNRWGDYSLTSIDPTDDQTLWTIQEHTRATDTWGTRIAKLEYPSPCPDPSAYCTISPNSAGAGAEITYSGSSSVAAADLGLVAFGCPSGKNGLFYYGPNQISVPFGNGVRCVGGGGIGTFRLSPQQTDMFGIATRALSFTSPPTGSGPGALAVGTTWNFQFWYRDPAGGGSGFNTSNGLNVTMCP